MPPRLGTSAVVSRRGESLVDFVREALDLERRDHAHEANGDRPDPADGYERCERGAGVGKGQDAEYNLEHPEDRQQPPVRQQPASRECAADRDGSPDDQPGAKEDRDREQTGAGATR